MVPSRVGSASGIERDQCAKLDGIDYTYDLFWSAAGSGCRWEAVVKRDGTVIGFPHAETANRNGIEPFEFATIQLRHVIETQLPAAAH